MYSITKSPISQATAQVLFASHLGSNGQITRFEELTDGCYNAAYRVELDNHPAYVLKIAPLAEIPILRYEKNIMEAEVEVMRLVRQRTEMPAPEVLAYDRSGRLIPNEFYIMTFLEGIPFNKLLPTLTPDEKIAIEHEAGRLTRQMNEITAPIFGYFAQDLSRSSSWRESFLAMLDGVLQDGLDIDKPLPRPYEQISALFRQHSAVLDEVTLPRLVHWDLWDGNIFVDPATKRITGLIDFERALWGDPLMEVKFADFQEHSPYMEGYGLELLHTPSGKLRRILYNIYLWLIMVIEPTYRHYDNPWQENWARGLLVNDLNRLEMLV